MKEEWEGGSGNWSAEYLTEALRATASAVELRLGAASVEDFGGPTRRGENWNSSLLHHRGTKCHEALPVKW